MRNGLRNCGRSEERYALAVDAAGDGHTDWIVATDEFHASPRLLEMCGLPAGTTFRSREDFLSRFPFHPEDRARVLSVINTYLATQTVRLETEMRILRHGETRWLHLTGLCSRDDAGALVRWNAAVTDITERKGAQLALSLSEERDARAMEASEEGHWEWNMATDEMFLSAHIRDMLGFAPDAQFSGREEFFLRQPIHPDDREHVAGARANILADRRYEVEYRILPRPGEVRWVRSRGKVFRDARGDTRITGTLTDITGNKLAEAALQYSQQRYALAMEAADEGHWDWDIATGEYYASPRMLELNGLPPDTVFANRAEFLAAFPCLPEDRPKWDEAAAAYFAGRTARFDIEIRTVPHGQTRWVHLDRAVVARRFRPASALDRRRRGHHGAQVGRGRVASFGASVCAGHGSHRRRPLGLEHPGGQGLRVAVAARDVRLAGGHDVREPRRMGRPLPFPSGRTSAL